MTIKNHFSMRLLRQKKAFGLIETIIAIFLFFITIAGGMNILFNADRITGVATNKKLALELANEGLEDILRDGYSNIPASGTTSSVSIGDFSATQTVLVTNIDEDSNGSTDYKKVEVRVIWRVGGEVTDRDVSVITYMVP